MSKKGFLFILSGSSGAGKTTVTRSVIAQLQTQGISIAWAVSYTSRPPREEEREGIDYHFISTKAFEKKLAAGFFLEHSKVYNAYYGTPRSLLDKIDQGDSYIIVVDRMGARAIKQVYPAAVLIWLYVSSVDELQMRLANRGTENNEAIMHRLELAKKEMEEERHNPFFDHRIENQDFEGTVQIAKKLILGYMRGQSCFK